MSLVRNATATIVREYEFYGILQILKIHEFSRILKCQRILKIKFAVMNYSKKWKSSLQTYK